MYRKHTCTCVVCYPLEWSLDYLYWAESSREQQEFPVSEAVVMDADRLNMPEIAKRLQMTRFGLRKYWFSEKNSVVACSSCNASKNDRLPSEWLSTANISAEMRRLEFDLVSQLNLCGIALRPPSRRYILLGK